MRYVLVLRMEPLLSDRHKTELARIRSEHLKTPLMLTSMEKVLGLLCGTSKEHDFLASCSLCYREPECISIEWPCKSIFCLFYANSTVLSRVYYLRFNETTLHQTGKLAYSDLETDFMREFEVIWHCDTLVAK